MLEWGGMLGWGGVLEWGGTLEWDGMLGWGGVEKDWDGEGLDSGGRGKGLDDMGQGLVLLYRQTGKQGRLGMLGVGRPAAVAGRLGRQQGRRPPGSRDWEL